MSATEELWLLRQKLNEQSTLLKQNFIELNTSFLSKNENQIPLSSVLQLLQEQNNLLDSFHSKLFQFFINPFENLPQELIEYIFLYISNLLDLRSISLVCKRFNYLLRKPHLWKNACLQFWTSTGFQETYRIDLTWTMKEVQSIDDTKDWIWLSKCFYRGENNNGLSYVCSQTQDEDEKLIDCICKFLYKDFKINFNSKKKVLERLILQNWKVGDSR
jgi:hypothetical protein